MPSQPEAQGDILKEFREGTFLSSLDNPTLRLTTNIESLRVRTLYPSDLTRKQ